MVFGVMRPWVSDLFLTYVTVRGGATIRTRL